ncbi:MAG: serine/threonine protein kinase [Acidobacteria bacterium]|nr:MAG: serine/threonine protein kinase [Acidobacteriota bacterium]
MSLSAGARLAHYEILEPIGKGGMGEVYRARDKKLGRDVAIKVLPEEFAENKERLRRFEREAKVLASLNHPNIAAIYGLEQHESTHYLVLELVEDETLAERIARGPIPVDEAIDIAIKISEALEEAHERGMIHRDLKPANIKITPDGKVKVLDFGLAKAFEEETPEADSSMSPTLTRHGTRAGVILGTAAYMSPEQAKGKKVDKRTDNFAFGAVLYEMLTGAKAFPGDDVPEILAAVIQLEPEWDALPAEVSNRLREMLVRCLEKDREMRWRDVGDVRITMQRLSREPSTHDAPPNLQSVQALRWGAVALGAAAIAAGATFFLARPSTRGSVVKSLITVAPAARLGSAGSARLASLSRTAMALSPDGKVIVFSASDGASSRLYRRSLDDFDAVPIENTEGASGSFFHRTTVTAIHLVQNWFAELERLAPKKE